MGCRITILKVCELAQIANGSSFARGAMTIGTIEHRYEVSGYTQNGNHHERRNEKLLPEPLGRSFLTLSVPFLHALRAPISILA
jgi:hypothetical protein